MTICSLLLVNPWVKGLISAAVSGAAGALGSMILDPAHFNTTHPRHLAIAALTGGLIGVVNYLRQSPWPAPPSVSP